MRIKQSKLRNRLSLNILAPRILSYLCITAFFIIPPLTGLSAETVEKKLNLSNCIEIALKNATSQKKAGYNVQLQSADVLRSYGSFLPKVSFSTSYTPYVLSRSFSQIYAGVDISKIKTESASVDLTLTTSLNLFNGFRDYAALQSALDKQRSAEYSLSQALQTVAFDVTQAYYQVLLDRELLDIARENLLAAQDQLTLTDKQFQIGLKSMIDRYQQQAEAAQSGLTVIKAETRYQRSTLELLRRLEIDPLTKLSLDPPPDQLKAPLASKPDIDSLITLALDQRVDLKSKVLESSAAKWQITESRSTFYPHLDLTVNVGTSGTESLRQTISGVPPIDYTFPPLSDQLGNSIGYSVGLNLSWSIFDGFQTSYTVQSAKINHLNQQLDYEELKKNIVIDLRQAVKEYSSAFMQIETARVSLTAASSAYDGVKRKYELGAASFVELSNARATLFNARSNLSQATYNLALQKSVLDFTTGNILQQQ
jgi:outer membrane protein